MKKYFALLSAAILAFAVSVFAQDGATKINLYNRTSSNLRFYVDNNPACTGDVIPGGFCVEPVNPGTYQVWASNGQQRTSGKTCSLNYGEYCDYTVYEQQSLNTNPNVKVTTVSNGATFDAGAGFSVITPVPLEDKGVESATTTSGVDYRRHSWAVTLANGDEYLAGVATYPFQVSEEDIGNTAQGFASGAHGTVTSTRRVNVSGNTAQASIVEATIDGHNYRFALLVAMRGNQLFVFVFSTDLAAPGTDNDAVKTFFTSATLN